MPVSVKIGGTWKTATAVFNKVGGAWKTASDMPVKIGGTWKTGILESGAFESIATVNVTSNTSTITFSSIPSTYKHLQIRYLIADSVTAGNLIYTRFNNDSGSNYTGHLLYGNGTSASAGMSGGTSQTQWQNWSTPNSGTSNPAAGIIDIHDYASTSKNKTARHIYGIPDSPNQYMVLQSGLWMSTSAINRIDFALFGGGQFGSGVKFALYGIKG